MRVIRSGIWVFCIVSGFLVHVHAQKKQLRKAHEEFRSYAYIDAIKSYEQLVADGLSEEEIYRQLGDANYVNAYYDEAEKWYDKLFHLQDLKVEKEYYFRYAQVLKSVGSYEKSDSLLLFFSQKFPEDLRGQKFLANQDYLRRIKEEGKRYELGTVTFNSESSDFAPAFYGEDLVFTTARDTGLTSQNVHEWNKGSFLNLHQVSFQGEHDAVKSFSKNINTKSHESSSVFTRDGLTVYFTRNNFQEGKFKRDGTGLSRLKLYRSQYKDGYWQKGEELPFNSADYSTAHPALSGDEQLLYFSSDMPGTNGMSDIYKVTINEDGSFGTPINLGNGINTEGRESFPFVHEDILYFSSDGHPGLGGLDVFAAKLDGASAQIINLGDPLNGQQDDFSFIIGNSDSGYLASNREGGLGSDDIYAFKQVRPLQFECISVVSGIVKDRETDRPLGKAKIVIKIGEDSLQQLSSDDDGVFEIEIDCNKEDHSLLVSQEGYLPFSERIFVQKGTSTEVVLALSKIKILQAKKGADLIEHLGLEPVYFDLDNAEIRKDALVTLNEVVKYLTEYPETKIAVHSHTDAKGSSGYNRKLSERRARATLEYLVSKGIDVSKISAQGFGEEKLINNCKVWVECTSDENQLNRRSEIVILE